MPQVRDSQHWEKRRINVVITWRRCVMPINCPAKVPVSISDPARRPSIFGHIFVRDDTQRHQSMDSFHLLPVGFSGTNDNTNHSIREADARRCRWLFSWFLALERTSWLGTAPSTSEKSLVNGKEDGLRTINSQSRSPLPISRTGKYDDHLELHHSCWLVVSRNSWSRYSTAGADPHSNATLEIPEWTEYRWIARFRWVSSTREVHAGQRDLIDIFKATFIDLILCKHSSHSHRPSEILYSSNFSLLPPSSFVAEVWPMSFLV